MDYSQMIQTLTHQFTPLTAVFAVLFVVSEILGSNEGIKASAIFKVIVAVKDTLRDQIWPKQEAKAEAPSAETPAV